MDLRVMIMKRYSILPWYPELLPDAVWCQKSVLDTKGQEWKGYKNLTSLSNLQFKQKSRIKKNGLKSLALSYPYQAFNVG